MGGGGSDPRNVPPVDAEIVKLAVGIARQFAHDAPIHIAGAEETTQEIHVHGLAPFGLTMPSAAGCDDGVFKRFLILTGVHLTCCAAKVNAAMQNDM
jgi:hypothetical protein